MNVEYYAIDMDDQDERTSFLRLAMSMAQLPDGKVAPALLKRQLRKAAETRVGPDVSRVNALVDKWYDECKQIKGRK